MSFDFEPDKLTAGAIGEVGNRTFLLQATKGSQVVTLKAEKEQLRALSAYLAKILEGLERPGHIPEDDELELTLPAEPVWTIGPINVTYEVEFDRLVMTCEQATFDESVADLDAPAANAVFRATREQIAALAIRSIQTVDAGRSPCPLCGFPLDQRGHVCPRTNGNNQPIN